MRLTKTVKNQSVIGLAVQLYGNIDAVRELLELNDLRGRMEQPTSFAADEIDLGYSLKAGVELTYDEASDLQDPRAIADMNGRVIVDGWERKGVYSKQYSKQYA